MSDEPADEKAKMEALFAKGLTRQDVARELGVSFSAVCRRMKKHKVHSIAQRFVGEKMRQWQADNPGIGGPGNRHPDTERRLLVIEEVSRRHGYMREAAKILGVSRYVVANLASEYGISFDPPPYESAPQKG